MNACIGSGSAMWAIALEIAEGRPAMQGPPGRVCIEYASATVQKHYIRLT
jgi:hypothetical protein